MPRAKRHPRRIPLSFEEIGAKSPLRVRGYSTNISLTGVFVATTHLAPVGARLKVVLEDGTSRIAFEGIVTRVQKVPPELRTVLQIGMGVRYVAPPEGIDKLLPAATADELAAAKPAAAAVVFTVRFASREEYETVLGRDIRRGGVFVATSAPAALHDTIQVAIEVPGAAEPPRFAAKVVHVMPTGMAVEFVDRAKVAATLGITAEVKPARA